MGQEPSDIRREIEETRERMGETVEAISYKADVKSRAGDYVSDKKEAVVSAVSGGVSKVTSPITGGVSRASDAMPDTGQVKHGARRAVGVAESNPLGLAIGSVAVGFIAGLLVPSTRVEDEKIGDVADRVKDTMKDTGQEALERGKQVAQEATSAAKDAATESGREQGQELASSLRENAQSVASGSSGSSAA